MAEDASYALQVAHRNALLAASAVTDLVSTRIYDYVPEREVFPYIELGASSTQEWDTSTDFGAQHLVTFHVWSRAEGKKEALAICRAIKETLRNNTALALTDHNLVNMQFLLSDVIRDNDGQSYHGVVQYRAITEEN